jgi:hypothetical protein
MKKDKEKTQSDTFADDILPVIKRLRKEGEEDKSDFYDACKRVYYWWDGTKSKIYTGSPDGNLNNDQQSSDQAVIRHYPLLWSYVEVMKAILLDEIKVLYTGKFKQGMEHIGDLGNAVFDALRIPMRWDDAIAKSIENMILFYEGVIGPYVNYNTFHPDTIPGIRTYNPWGYYQTRGCHFINAPERLLVDTIERADLIQIFPSKATDIENLKSWGSDSEAITKVKSGSSDLSLLSDLPGPWGDEKKFSDNSIRLHELWQRDTSRTKNSEKADIEKARQENDLYIDWLGMDGGPQGAPPDTTYWLEDQDYHDNHIPIHRGWVAMQQNSEYMRMYPEATRMAMQEMELHISEHEDKKEIYPTGRQGYVFTYSRGWRYSLVANEKLLLADGESPWLEEFGIVGPPFTVFGMNADPLNVWGNPWAQRLVDLNANYSSFMNYIQEVFESGGDKYAVKPEGLEGGIKGMSNHPREPFKVKSSESISDVIQSVRGPGLNPQLFTYLHEMRDILEQAAGVHDPMMGKPGSNVRSAEQLRGLVSQNEFIVNYHMKRIIPAIKELAVMVWQVAVGLGLDKDYLKPVINGIMVDYEVDQLAELEEAPFTVEVKVRSSGLTSTEEKRQIVEQVIPKMLELYPGLPGANDIIAQELVEIYGDDFPGLKNMAKKLAQAQKQMMEQAAAAQNAMVPGGEPGMGPGGSQMPEGMPPQQGNRTPNLQVLP